MIVIVELGLGNVSSIQNMFKRVGASSEVSADWDTVANADKLVLPGVGAFDAGMSRLRETGLIPLLTERAITDAIPMLGICLGMQLMTEGSEEGVLPGLGWIAGRARRLRVEPLRLKVPHMGWNLVRPTRTDTLFANADADSRYYFVHSYHVVCEEESDVLSWTDYGEPFASAVHRGSLFATQFHPEKSHRFGMNLLYNFARLNS